jgi:NAD(P)-dependent dehydrogenase (short-subunit alcohol dehydrogenase family)
MLTNAATQQLVQRDEYSLCKILHPIMSSAHKIVLITGANQGIGYLAALQLSKLDGYRILVGARSVDKGAEAVKKIESDGAKSAVEPILVDLDADDSIFAAVKKIDSQFGRLDVLVVGLVA